MKNLYPVSLGGKKLYRQLGFDEAEFHELFFEQGCLFAELMGAYQLIVQSPQYWQWWQLNWTVYDAKFRYGTMPQTPSYQWKVAYQQFHAADQKQRLSHSYYYLVSTLRNNSKNHGRKTNRPTKQNTLRLTQSVGS